MISVETLLNQGGDLLKNRRLLKKQLVEQENLIEKNIAILAGSTIGEIKNILELFLLSHGIKPIFYIGEYNRYYEEGVFENNRLAEFQPDIIYIHTTNKNIEELPSVTDTIDIRDEKLNAVYHKFEHLWGSLSRRYQCPIIQNNFESFHYRIMGNADVYFENGRIRFVNELNEKICKYARETKNLYVNDINYIAAYYGLEKWSNMSLWHLYKYAMDLEAVPLLCHNIANIIKSIYGKNKKAIILDLDNTLWGGVIGDDGLENIKLGEESPEGRAFSEFQGYLKELSKVGVVLNVCSKNELENAENGFTHKSSILQKGDFYSFKANWDNKADNIRAILKEINLLEESMVFIDDNPAERELVKGQLKVISVPEISTPEAFAKTIGKMGYFEVTALSEDDLKRKDFYTIDRVRKAELLEYSNYREYLISLEMISTVEPFRWEQIERITQLINKTNQFNFTTRRYTQAEIEEIMRSPSYITLKADLQDKFGDNGLVTCLIGGVSGKELTIELWVMSCRVFKRDLELAVFDCLVEKCIAMGVKEIRGIYRLTTKNKMLKEFYGELGFKQLSENADETIWIYEISKHYICKNKVIGVK